MVISYEELDSHLRSKFAGWSYGPDAFMISGCSYVILFFAMHMIARNRMLVLLTLVVSFVVLSLLLRSSNEQTMYAMSLSLLVNCCLVLLATGQDLFEGTKDAVNLLIARADNRVVTSSSGLERPLLG